MRPSTLLALSLLSLASYSLAVIAETSPSNLQLFVGKSHRLGTQLWQTDNTAAGTKVFSYLTKSPTADSKPYPLGVTGNYGIFAAFTPETGQELWRTDGRAAGTVLVKELAAGAASGLAQQQDINAISSLDLNGKVLFWSQVEPQLQLMSTDGRAEGTQVLKSFPFTLESGVNVALPDLHAFKNLAFFWVDDGKHGFELWQTDGTPAGTKLVQDASVDERFVDVYGDSPIQSENSLFFVSPDKRSAKPEETFAQSIWRTDGKTTEHLLQIPAKHYLTLVAANQQQLVWVQTSQQDPAPEPEIWQLDLSTNQVQRINYIQPNQASGTRSLNSAKALFFKGQLYLWFSTLDEQHIEELWRTDFTQTGTERLVSLPNPNGEYQAAPMLFSFADRLYFFLSDGIRPSELWTTDGTVAGTKNLLKVKDGQYAGGAGDSWPARPVPYVLHKDKLIFPTFSPKDRNLSQIWSLSPTQPEQPQLLGEFSDPLLLPPASNEPDALIYFISGQERWQTDGTLAGTKSLGIEALRKYWEPTPWPVGGLTRILPLPSSTPSWLLAEQDRVAGQEYWLLNSTPATSKVLKDINSAPASSDVKQVHQLGADWYFVLNSRLWMTQQDPATAHEVEDIPKTESFSFNAQSALKFQETLYFLTENAEKTNSLWQIKNGQAKRLKTFPKTGYSWLFPSSQGVYAAYFPPDTADAWTLDLWQAQEEKFVPILKETEDKRRLATMLETERGLLYILEPNSALGGATTAYTLMLHPQNGADLILKDSFEPVPNVLNNTLFSTTNNSYLLTQKENDPLNYQLFRIDWTTHQLVEVKAPALPQQTTLLAAPHGLFISSPEPSASLWWLADDAEQPSLIKEFAAKVYLDLVKVVDEKLYFNLLRLTQNDPPREWWMTDNTGEGIRKLANDLEMIRD